MRVRYQKRTGEHMTPRDYTVLTQDKPRGRWKVAGWVSGFGASPGGWARPRHRREGLDAVPAQPRRSGPRHAGRPHLPGSGRDLTMQLTTKQQRAAIGFAVQRETDSRTPWAEIKDQTLEQLCAANQDALIDDWFDDPNLTGKGRVAILEAVTVYDGLLGTNRVSELTPVPA